MRSATEHTEEALIGRLAQGSEEAFMDIYHRYWQKVFAIAYSRLKNIQEAEDVVHDVFTSLWANRSHTQIRMLENYLATAAKYTVLGRIRAANQAQAYLRAVTPTEMAHTPQVEESLHYRRILELVHREVERLPEKCRMVFRYSRDEGLSVKQIANLMHISPKTVENQLSKALRHVKLALRSFLPLFIGFCLHFLSWISLF